MKKLNRPLGHSILMPELDTRAEHEPPPVLKCEFRVINLTEALVPLVLKTLCTSSSGKLRICPPARRAGGGESRGVRCRGESEPTPSPTAVLQLIRAELMVKGHM